VSKLKQPTPPLPPSLLAAGSLAGVAFFQAAAGGGGGGGGGGERSQRVAGGAGQSAGGDGGGGGGGLHEKTNQVRRAPPRNATQSNAARGACNAQRAAQRSAAQRSATQRNATQRNATRRNATQRNAHARSLRHWLGAGSCAWAGGVYFVFLFGCLAGEWMRARGCSPLPHAAPRPRPVSLSLTLDSLAPACRPPRPACARVAPEPQDVCFVQHPIGGQSDLALIGVCDGHGPEGHLVRACILYSLYSLYSCARSSLLKCIVLFDIILY
jgi:hypothetical protein